MSASHRPPEGTSASDRRGQPDPPHGGRSPGLRGIPLRPLIPVIIFLFLGLLAGLAVGWIAYPKLLYSHHEQPLSFNHALHVEQMGGCEGCHMFRDDGSFTGIPTLESCAGCHEEPLGESQAELRLVEEYIRPGREIPWFVYSRQPDCVHFSHAAHVITGEIECATCHGPIGESGSLRVYERNRLTGYSRDIWGANIAGLKRNPWDRMKMSDCAECHAREGVRQASVQTKKGGCFVCHK